MDAKIDALRNEMNTKFTNYYTKNEINNLLANYYPKSSLYTKSEINSLLSGYYPKSSLYTKSEISSLFDGYYSKSEVDALTKSSSEFTVTRHNERPIGCSGGVRQNNIYDALTTNYNGVTWILSTRTIQSGMCSPDPGAGGGGGH